MHVVVDVMIIIMHMSSVHSRPQGGMAGLPFQMNSVSFHWPLTEGFAFFNSFGTGAAITDTANNRTNSGLMGNLRVGATFSCAPPTRTHASGSPASPGVIPSPSATLGGNPLHQELPCPAVGRIRFAR